MIAAATIRRISMAFAVLGCAVVQAAALTWTRANATTDLTIALYHFDEPSGVVAGNAQGAASRHLLLEDAGMRRLEQNGWIAGTNGYISTSNAFVASAPRFNVPIDWSQDDVTVSFWFRTPRAPSVGIAPAEGVPQPWGARCGFGWTTNASLPLQPYFRNLPISVAGVGSNEVFDGQWHHCAFAYNAQQARVAIYLDNLLQTNVDVSAGETNGFLNMLHIGDGPSAAIRSEDDIDELLIERAYITDFSNGNPVPEAGAAVYGMLCASMALRARRRRND
jgi:hypothetical protein